MLAAYQKLNKKRYSKETQAVCVSLFAFRGFKMFFQDHVDVLGERTVVLLRELFDFFDNVRIKGDADFAFQWFHGRYLVCRERFAQYNST